MAANLSGVLPRLASVVVQPDASKCNDLGPKNRLHLRTSAYCFRIHGRSPSRMGPESTQQAQSTSAWLKTECRF